MKCEGMPTLRHEEKRVEERNSVRGREGERETERERKSTRTQRREREHARAFAPPFICFPPPGPSLCKLGQPEVLFLLPKVLTLVLGPSFDLPLFYFCGLFTSLSFSHCRFGLLFPILTT